MYVFLVIEFLQKEQLLYQQISLPWYEISIADSVYRKRKLQKIEIKSGSWILTYQNSSTVLISLLLSHRKWAAICLECWKFMPSLFVAMPALLYKIFNHYWTTNNMHKNATDLNSDNMNHNGKCKEWWQKWASNWVANESQLKICRKKEEEELIES